MKYPEARVIERRGGEGRTGIEGQVVSLQWWELGSAVVWVPMWALWWVTGLVAALE